MPAASPDGPSDAEEGERRRGINAPPENGQQKMPMHRRAVGGYRIASWCPPTVSSGLAPRADRIRLQSLHQGVRPLEQGRGCGLWLPAADLGLDRLLGHELGPGERRPLPSHTPALPCDGCTARPSFATLDTWRFPTNGYSIPSVRCRSSTRRDWRESSARPTQLDKIKNLHPTDTIATENSGTRGRSD